MSFSLIVPIAAYKEEYEINIPKVFHMSSDGTMLCVKAILGLNLSVFDKVYYTILKSLDDKYMISDMLKLQFKKRNITNVEIVILDKITNSQPETIYKTIKEKNIQGSVFIKDSDSYFEGEVLAQNSVAIYSLEDLLWVNPQDKSYVAIDDMNYITNIIEKKIVSRYFSVGGYCFEDASSFCEYFERHQHFPKLYLSHIIYSMLLDRHLFRPIISDNYKDFWNNYE